MGNRQLKMRLQNSIYERKKKDAERKRHETQIHEDTIKIISALHRVIDYQETAIQQNKTAEKGKRHREIATIIGIYLAAIVAIGAVAFATLDARKQAQLTRVSNEINRTTMVASSRAWIAPYRFKAPEKLEAPPAKNIEIDLLIMNVGREPARRYTPEWQAIAIEKDTFTKANEVEKIINNTDVGRKCKSLIPAERGITIYPGIPEGNKLVFSVSREDVAKFDEGTHWIMGFGCFAYVTIDGPHVSKFCAVLEPTYRNAPDNWRTAFCRVHNDAN